MPHRTLYRAIVAVAAAGAVALAVGCAAKPRERPIELGPVDTGPGSLKAARDFLQGRWALLSFEVRPPGQAPIQVPGSGTLLYDEFSNLKMDIRVDAATGEALAKAGIAVQDGMLSSQGRAVLNVADHTLTYVMEGQSPFAAPSGPLGPTRPRHWQVEGDVLTLSTKDDQGNVLSIARWRRQP
jgi:hypothetical protein